MKTNAKTYPLLRRALTSKQFEAFVEIREVQSFFEELATIERDEVRKAESWQKHFSEFESEESKVKPETDKSQTTIVDTLLTKYLHLAAKGNVSFLVDDPNYTKLVSSLPFPANRKKDLIEAVSQSFYQYSESSQKYSGFKKAEEKLMLCAEKTRSGNTKINHRALKQYHQFMQSSGGELKGFDDFTDRHTSVIVGKHYYELYRNAHLKLAELDPAAVKNKSFSDVTLRTFGANITGCRGINRNLLKQHLADEQALGTYTKEHYSRMSEIGDAIYSGLKFTGSKQGLRNAILVTAAGIALLSAPLIPGYQHAANYQSSNIYTQIEQGQELGISNETLEALKLSRETLTTLQNSGDFPDIDTILDMREMLDDNMDLIFSDLVTPAFEAENPNYQVTNVETRYDLSSSNPENPDRWVAIEYIDEKGDTQTKRVTSIDGENPISTIFQNVFFNKYTSVRGTFDAEINLDNYFFTLLSQIKYAGNFEDKAAAYSNMFDFLDATLSAEEIVAAKKVVYKDGLFSMFPSISFDVPEQVENDAAEQSDSTSTQTLENPSLDDNDER